MPAPEDLGFSEFIAKLISETFTAVTEAALEQERRYAQLSAAAALPLEEFLDAFVEDADVDRALLERFPPPGDGEGGNPNLSSAAAGQPYTPATDESAEEPALLEQLGLEVDPREVTKAGNIGSALAARIREAVALELGRQEWEIARAIVQRGVPRVIVDSGHIMAKQTYRVVKASDEPEPPAPAPAVLPVRTARLPLTSPILVDKILRPAIRPDLVLRVTSPRANGPVAQGDIYGEVEIRFKTVP